MGSIVSWALPLNVITEVWAFRNDQFLMFYFSVGLPRQTEIYLHLTGFRLNFVELACHSMLLMMRWWVLELVFIR